MKHFLLFAKPQLQAVPGAGCNTVHGMGQAPQNAGEGLQDVVKKK